MPKHHMYTDSGVIYFKLAPLVCGATCYKL